MVVQFHVECIAVLPGETYPPTDRNPNAVPFLPYSFESFQPIARWNPKITEFRGVVDSIQFLSYPVD
jgi:hypothetical protein